MNVPPKTHFFQNLRTEALGLPESGIVEVMNIGRNRQGLIPLWVGESDVPTPDFICEAHHASLQAGETFYTYQRGIPDLRAAIADYCTRIYGELHGKPFSPERFFVTIGGMHAIQTAVRMIAGHGDEILVPTPAWPNFAGALIAAGAKPVDVPMVLAERNGEAANWFLNIDDLQAAVTPTTRGIIINSPSNPTGWTATREELQQILDFARAHNIWIIADEIYGRIVYNGTRAPSFHDIMRPDDRIMFVQTFSKNWAMTGWRIGWLEAPPELGQIIENLVQFSSSGVPVATQRAAIAALQQGEPFVEAQIAKLRGNRDLICDALTGSGVHFAKPAGAFYLFCRIDGEEDTRKLSRDLIEGANLGVAPGSAFGTGAEAYIRLCFARKASDMAEVARRLRHWLGNRG
eukprot:gene6999-7068_t